ncbi:MAG: hypothetical protein HY260_18545 [Chloroflexi bacterium]|nr:hypothetical protein [Chloroflexota bacterium]
MSTEIPSPSEKTENVQKQVWPEWVYPYPAGIIGGLLGGAAIALVGIGYGLISGKGIWLPVNLVAATALRAMQSQSLESLMQFNVAALVVGLVIHITMSIGLGEVFSFILPALPGRPLYWGPVIGPMLLIGATIAALPIVNPVMVRNVDLTSFALANVLYGLLLGWWIDRTPLIHMTS